MFSFGTLFFGGVEIDKAIRLRQNGEGEMVMNLAPVLIYFRQIMIQSTRLLNRVEQGKRKYTTENLHL